MKTIWWDKNMVEDYLRMCPLKLFRESLERLALTEEPRLAPHRVVREVKPNVFRDDIGNYLTTCHQGVAIVPEELSMIDVARLLSSLSGVWNLRRYPVVDRGFMFTYQIPYWWWTKVPFLDSEEEYLNFLLKGVYFILDPSYTKGVVSSVPS